MKTKHKLDLKIPGVRLKWQTSREGSSSRLEEKELACEEDARRALEHDAQIEDSTTEVAFETCEEEEIEDEDCSGSRQDHED